VGNPTSFEKPEPRMRASFGLLSLVVIISISYSCKRKNKGQVVS
jgi:hypothetical protein